MSFNKQISQPQAIAIAAAFVLLLGLLFWAGSQLRSRNSTAAAPVELQPVVEEVVASPRETAVAAPAGPRSDEAARRQEVLENLKFGIQHSQ